MAVVKLTKTQQAFFDLMADGQRHYVDEFINLLPDELSGEKGVQNHIYLLRKSLENTIHDVVCEIIQRRTSYRRVRHLYDERGPNPAEQTA